MAFPTSGGPVASHSIAGFDVQGDLIAAATGDGRVQLFSVSSGREVRMRGMERQQQQQGEGGSGGWRGKRQRKGSSSASGGSRGGGEERAAWEKEGGVGGQKRCLKFIDDNERQNKKMLCVASDGIVEEWS